MTNSTITKDSDRLSLETLEDFVTETPPVPGNIDIICLGATSVPTDAAASISLLLSYAHVETKQPLYPSVYAILDEDVVTEAIRAQCLDMLVTLMPDQDREKLSRILAVRIRFIVVTSYEFDFILNLLRDAPSQTAFVILNASRFRAAEPVQSKNTRVAGTTPFEETILVSVPENDWVFPLVTFVSTARPTVKDRHLYVLLLTGEYYPALSHNLEALRESETTVYGASAPDAENELAQRNERWITMMANGQHDVVFGEIDNLELTELNKKLLKAQILLLAGRGAEGYELIRPQMTEALRECNAAILTNVSRMALHGGDPDESLSLLDAAIAKAPRQELTLRMLHQHARVLGARVQREKTYELLQRWFPNSYYTIAIVVERHLKHREYSQIQAALSKFNAASLSNFLRYALMLAAELGSQQIPDYKRAVAAVASQVPDYAQRARLHCAQHALYHDDIETAVALATNESWENEQTEKAASEIIIETVKRWALSAPRGSHKGDAAYEKYERDFQALLSAIPFVLHYLSEHPENGDLRVELTTSLATDRLGDYGHSILVNLLDHTGPPTFNPTPRLDTVEPASEDEFLCFFREYFDRYDRNRSIFSAPEPIPTELRSERLDALRRAAVMYVGSMTEGLCRDPDLKEPMLMAFRIASDISYHLGRQYEAFELFKTVVSALVNAGDFQTARDAAEHALLMLAGRRDPTQKYAAWLIFAEVYARCHNLPEAILGWLCAAQHQGVELSNAQAGQDALLYVRLLRDVRLYDRALDALRHAAQTLSDSHLAEHVAHRLDHLESTIHIARLLNESESYQDHDFARLSQLAASMLPKALAEHDDLFPSAMFVAQVLALHARHGQPEPSDLREALNEALNLMSDEAAAVLRVLADPAPGRDDLLLISRGLQQTRFSADLSMDLLFVQVHARRALYGFVERADGRGALLAVEFLALHAIRAKAPINTIAERQLEAAADQVRAWANNRSVDSIDAQERQALLRVSQRLSTPQGPRDDTTIARLITQPELLDEIVERFTKGAIRIHALALNHRDRLVRVSVHGGEISAPVEESLSVFDASKLAQWRKDHPYLYGAPGDDEKQREQLAYVEKTMSGIGTSAPSSDETSVYLVGHQLSDVPVGLLRIGNQFAGHVGPLAVVPSLTWLHTTLSTEAAPTDRRVAWFLPASEEERLPPLLILRSLLEEELDRRGFTINIGTDLATNNRKSDLAIVGGHGSVWPENRTFRAIADEVRTRFSISEFAAQLANTAVVVLLVCSGGRIDRDVVTLGATGLPHELIHRGCRAVVGSPWPLDVFVARKWTIHFVQAWNEGMPVAEATYFANDEVRMWAPDKSSSLAMHVIGNPFERRRI